MLIVTLAGIVIAVVVTMISSVGVIDPLILIFSIIVITIYYSTAIQYFNYLKKIYHVYVKQVTMCIVFAL